MEKAIEDAAENILSNVKQPKKSRPKKCTPLNLAPCQNLQVELELEEGKKSPILLAPGKNRKFERREAVFEKNETERTLVKVTLRNLIQGREIEKLI